MSDRIRIEISGKAHSGKTTATAAIARALEGLGADVVVQACDPQLADKMEAPTEDLAKRLDGVTIVITEMQTAR